MAGIWTANDQIESLDDLRGRWVYLLARVKSDKNAAAYVAPVTNFGPQWTAAHQKEMDKEDAVTIAQAAASGADLALDGLVRKVSTAIFGGKKINVDLPLAIVFFGGLSPSEFMAPTLGKQLTGMLSWPSKLAQAAQPALSALVPQASVVPAAETAATALASAIADRIMFHDGGERKGIFEAFNALCATVYGGLQTFAHNNPTLDLPPGWAESFFKQGPPSSQPKTLTAARELAQRLTQKLGKAQAVIAELTQKEQAYEAQVKAHERAVADEH